MPPELTGSNPAAGGRSRADRRGLLAVAATFAINGAILATLLPRYPQVAASTGASAAEFGLALAAIGVGGFVGAASAPVLARRLGLVRVVVAGGVVLAGAALAVGLAPGVVALAVAFSVAGAADGVHDVAMNEVGLGEQDRLDRSVMGRLHGAWSVGATLGSAVGALMAGLQVPVAVHAGGVAIAAAAAQIAVGRHLRSRSPGGGLAPPGPEPDGRRQRTSSPSGRVHPRRRVLLSLLGLVTLAAMAAEGVPLDWSALVLRRALDASPGVAGLGPVVFSAGVLTGRLAIDPLIDRVGPGRVVRGSALLAALAMGVGLPAAAASESPWPLLVALVVAGAGAASTFPLLFSAGDGVARRLGLPEGSGTSIIGMLPRLGGLVLPVTVGLIASSFGLLAALGVVILGATVVAAVLPRLLRT
jgi:predicted MFS family arabinose efflux permease